MKIFPFILATAIVGCLFHSVLAYAANGAQFVAQSVPSAMVAGQTYPLSVTMKNTGTTAWTLAGAYKLGAQNPQDNGIWTGNDRVLLPAGESVAPGQTKTFAFNVKAPSINGTYNFQWRMVQEFVQWFGDYSTNVPVTVADPAYANLISKVKYNGCIAAGLLNSSGYWTDSINRSGCQYVHRALDTEWGLIDFAAAKSKMAQVTKSGMVYDMFISEGINTIRTYYYPDENRNFNFSAMCKSGTLGWWGANTCIPSYASDEYRKYLRYITRSAIDIGIQTFSFAQVYLGDNMSSPILPSIIDEIKQYAASKGKTVLVGGQTNNISDQNYLRKMDYVIGGLGENDQGVLETGSCSSKWTDSSNSCWALLYNQPWLSYANNVIIHMDWDGRTNSDADTFAHMSSAARASFLQNTYSALKAKGAGFMLPYAIPVVSGSVCGSSGGVYTPDNNGPCKDEDAINKILGVGVPNSAQFVSQSVPSAMTAGQTYLVSVAMKNSGTTAWTAATNYRLGSQNAQDNTTWGMGRVNLVTGDSITNGQTKTFNFNVTAPAVAGTYNFQWQMVQDGVAWFGDKSANVSVIVSSSSTCVSKTCTGLGISCGAASDGCNQTLSCGSCASGQTCSAGKCVSTCVPKTCAQLGFSCGAASDGCNGSLNCGTCTGAQTCSTNVCVASSISTGDVLSAAYADLEAQGCGGDVNGYPHLACRASRYCASKGYTSGFQTEWGTPTNVVCVRGDVLSAAYADLDAQGCGGDVNGYPHLACRASRYCASKGYTSGFQTEWGTPSGSAYCLGTKKMTMANDKSYTWLSNLEAALLSIQTQIEILAARLATLLK